MAYEFTNLAEEELQKFPVSKRDEIRRAAQRIACRREPTSYGMFVVDSVDVLNGYNNAKRNATRRERHHAMIDLGLKRVKGALGGVYYE